MKVSDSHIARVDAGSGHAEAAPFDHLTADYDLSFSSTLLGKLMRDAVASETRQIYRTGPRVLDLGCGTGEDAMRLARRGRHARQLEDEFRPQFRCVRTAGIGVLLPPTFATRLVERYAGAARWLASTERHIRHVRAAAYLSDHFLIELERS